MIRIYALYASAAVIKEKLDIDCLLFLNRMTGYFDLPYSFRTVLNLACPITEKA